MALVSILVINFSLPDTLVFSGLNSGPILREASPRPDRTAVPSPAVLAVAGFLEKYKVDAQHRHRVAEAIITSTRKYNIDPRLVAAIMIVESRADPFAISTRDSIGIMQIHLPTWGPTADKEDINLFKIEDNVDFGVRILRDYVRRYGLWDGVKRYKGYNSASLQSTQSVEDYLQRVRKLYAQ
ncbi:MAG: lytic transglycosylase domain-containing protein [Acidobacteria bacterium]|nr:lytic transglycosylase domain-containing protein [Acidobacteriota bacterium]